MKTGAQLVVEALEREGVRFTFGIPGTHNTELYDVLAHSTIQPILVTDEQSAGFMADAVSRTTDSVGVLNVVPGAGMTHAMSGIAEAYMDSVPLVALLCGIRTDTGKKHQLHDVDQLAMIAPVCKATYHVNSHDEIPKIFAEAFALAKAGEPGPVAIEVPANLYLFKGECRGGSRTVPTDESPIPDVSDAVALLAQSQKPILYVGWGARNAAVGAVHEPPLLIQLVEALQCPVVTTFSGLGVFPSSHPLHLWHTLGAAAPGFVNKIYDESDCMLAVACKFGEVATASYGFKPPQNLIHIDINEKVLNANHPAKIALKGDARGILKKILERKGEFTKGINTELPARIRKGKEDFRNDYRKEQNDKVTPLVFFETLRTLLPNDSIIVCDSGNHTFMTAELMPFEKPSTFLAPIDYSCMGYGVPAAVGAKLANPNRKVVGVIGDGAFLMTGLELLTAAQQRVGAVICVFSDFELGLIAQFQEVPLNLKTATRLQHYKLRGIAEAVGATYLPIENNHQIAPVLRHALEESEQNLPVIVDVKIDYSQKTQFAKGVIKTNLNRLPFKDRMRFIARAVGRRV
ncbi:MAG: thiamine pyrophosphate-binding protein, partial [Deltaproteobacteria bacterium]|nr:thiamine pyrophosphate-binding protein [Deltaproteobacteria bacterium]